MSTSPSYYFLPHYSSAGWFIPVALHDLLDALGAYPAISASVGAAISTWFHDHRDELREGRFPHTPEHWAAIDILDKPLSDIELRVAYAASIATFMAAIDLEARINRALAVHFGDGVAEALDALQLLRKFEVAFGLRGLPFRTTHFHEGARELVAWRNEFAHGNETGSPRSLRYTDSPTRPPATRAYVEESAHLLRHYLMVAKHMDTLDPARASTDHGEEYAVIERLLREIGAVAYNQHGHPIAP